MSPDISWRLNPTDPSTFSGSAFTRLLGTANSAVPVKLYYVRFEPGARTNWHSHSGTQILVVTEGRCRYQVAGELPGELGAGESVSFAAGVKHWHGALPTEAGEHIAINLTTGDTVWLEPVTEDEYGG